jgi:hypothetical protein
MDMTNQEGSQGLTSPNLWPQYQVRKEATNTNFKVFGLIRPGLEPTIYRTRGQHANHYAIDAVILELNVMCFFLLFIFYFVKIMLEK